jgi:radical SAM superfamily enzyme YgiQ (UPF0313 family)
MKVSFLKPPVGGIIGLEIITFVEPLGLECVAGALELDGHECKIVDLRIEGLDRGLKKNLEFEPEIVGLQCNFTTERYRALRVARKVKEQLPEALIVLGGHDVSRDPHWFLKPGIDVLAVGDGEEIMSDLVTAWETKHDLTGVPGLVLNTPAGPVSTGPAPVRGLIDDLPLPARHLIKDYQNEYYINFRRPLALLETARGCPFKCNFCSVWKFHESTFREKSPSRVVEELQQIDAPNVFITDDIFWMNVHRGKALAKALKESGIKKHYTIQTRSDIICKFPELIEMWRDCGQMTIFLGLEKIDDEGLKSVNKSNTAAKNDRAIEILQDLDVGYTPNFIVDPDWGIEQFDKLKAWVDRTGAYNSGFSVLTPLPGTDLWDEVEDQVNTEDWELFDITHSVLPTKLPLPEFYEQYAGLWKHSLETRFKHKGKLKCYLGMIYAMASGKVTLGAMRKGMRLGLSNVLARAETYMVGHNTSQQRLEAAVELDRDLRQAAA